MCVINKCVTESDKAIYILFVHFASARMFMNEIYSNNCLYTLGRPEMHRDASERLFTFGIKICSGWSDYKWTALKALLIGSYYLGLYASKHAPYLATQNECFYTKKDLT